VLFLDCKKTYNGIVENEFDAELVDSLLKRIAANMHKQKEGCQCLL